MLPQDNKNVTTGQYKCYHRTIKMLPQDNKHFLKHERYFPLELIN